MQSLPTSCYLSVVFIVGLFLLYHSYLMLSGQTTWEQVSRNRIAYLKDLQELSNPFDEGCCCNVARFVCCGLRDWEQVYLSRTKASRTKCIDIIVIIPFHGHHVMEFRSLRMRARALLFITISGSTITSLGQLPIMGIKCSSADFRFIWLLVSQFLCQRS